MMREFDLIVVRGRRTQEELSNHGMTSVRVITGAVSRPELATHEHRKYDVVFVGRLAPIKQPEQFLHIVAEVRRHIPGVRAAVLGDGPLEDTLHRLAERLQLDGAIDWLGQRDDPERVLGLSRVFLLTSRSEGLSIAMAEAMALGTVPVVADVGALSELVRDGVSGFLIEPNRIDRYVQAVLELLKEPARWDSCSHAARRTARERVGLELVSDRWRAALGLRVDGAHMEPRP